MSSNNPIQYPLNELLERLNRLNGLLLILENQLNNFRNLFKERLDKSNLELSSISAGAALVIRDLTEYPEDRWPVYYSTGSFVSQGEVYLQMIDVLVSREAAWTVSQGYEAFETFLKNITAAFLFRHSQYADANQLTKLDSMPTKSAVKPERFEYWEEFIARRYRTNSELFKFLRKIAPELGEAEKRNNRNMDLNEWYIVVGEVRHAVTHADMLIKPKRMQSWLPARRELLTNWFPGKDKIDDGYEPELDRKDAEKTLVQFAEYAYTVFKCLSKLENYNWKVFK